MKLFFALFVAVALAQNAETCGDVKLFSQELGSPSNAGRLFYLNDEQGDDENYLFVINDAGELFSSVDGGNHWTKESPNMPHAYESSVPYSRLGVNHLYASPDGEHVWCSSYKLGFWHKARNADWQYLSTGKDFLLELHPHPTQSQWVLGVFRGEGCYNHTAGVSCKSFLRLSMDAGATWTELSKQVIQVAWSTHSDSRVFFSEHYDAEGDFNVQTWYQSKLYGVVLGLGGTVQSKTTLLDHQSGMAYKNGTMLVAQRVSETGSEVTLWTSTDDGHGGNLDKAVFRGFFDDEVTARSFNILDLTAGSIFINVRTDSGKYDRGDLYMSGALDHDFRLVLPDNVRGGALGDFAKLGSLRGVYIANVYAAPDDDVVTGITYDMGASWDFVDVPETLKSRCNTTDPYTWCGVHLLGRSNGDIGEAPYSANGAIGLAMATGNVGETLALDSPEDMATFLTRDGGVTWKEIATGDNVYAMADRGAVVAWGTKGGSSESMYWSWDEGQTHQTCPFGALGHQTIHDVSASPSHDGLQVHFFTESDGKHYIVTADFSTLAETKCTGEDTPNTPTSSYETWTPKDPDGEQGCLLGSKTTYVRRKANVKCFNVDNDLVHEPVLCNCERDDYECDDCYEKEFFWDKNSSCVRKPGPCFAYSTYPCTGSQTYYSKTRGYQKIPADQCITKPDDPYAPVQALCSSWTPPTTVATTHPIAPSSTISPTTSPEHPPPPGFTTTTVVTTRPTDGDSSGGGWKAAVAIVVLLVLIGGLVGGFLYARKQPGFRRRFGGRIPFVSAPEDPYSTLGELDTSGSAGFDDDGF